MTEIDIQEQEHQKDLERIKNYCLMNDEFLNSFLDGDIKNTKLILDIILDRDDIDVISSRAQRLKKNFVRHSLFLDILAVDSSGTKYDIEIQREDKGAGYKRARYHSALIDARSLIKGDDFDLLPESYVIFITENDVINQNQPIYFIDRRITNVDLPFDDGEHIIYVNGKNQNVNTALGRLMHDFLEKDPDKMYYKSLAERMYYFKKDEEGVRAMSRELEQMRKEAAERAEFNAKLDIANKMIADGVLTISQIVNYSGLPVETVTELAKA